MAENVPPRLTRAAAKRASVVDASIPQPQPKKKRVALGELPNLSNAVNPRTDAVKSKPTRTRSEKTKKLSQLQDVADVATIKATDEEYEVEDPQMVAPYASDIYQYLRSMEVGS